MSKPIVDDGFDSLPSRPESIEDTFRHATSKQINYIEILRHSLGLSIPTLNVRVMEATGKSFAGDMWSLSTKEASLVINKLKEMES